jgi:hypothetical protein
LVAKWRPILSLPPGTSRTLEISAVTPAAPGDASGSIVFSAPAELQNSIRSLW